MKVERACLHRANSRRDIALFADENHGWIAIFNDPPLQVQAVKSRRPMFKITQAAKSVPSGLRYSAAEAHSTTTLPHAMRYAEIFARTSGSASTT